MTPKKIAIIALTVIALIVFNRSSVSVKSAEQVDFESWLVGVEKVFQSAEPLPETEGVITVRVKSEIRSRPFEWTLSSSNSSPDQNDKLLRILALLRESNVFTGPLGSRSTNSNRIQIDVNQGQRSFSALITEEDVALNVKAQNMLKLFELAAISSKLEVVKNIAEAAQ